MLYLSLLRLKKKYIQVQIKNKLVLVVSTIAIAVLTWSFGCNVNNATAANNVDPLESVTNEKKHESISEEKQKAIMFTLYEMMTKGHYSPKVFDAAFSQNVFDEFMENMDIGKQHFTQKDIDGFAKYKKDLGTQLKNGDLTFFNEVYNTYSSRVLESKICIDKIFAGPISFTGKGEINLDGTKIKYCKNESDKCKRWEDFITYRVLSKFTELEELQNTKKDTIKDWKLISRETLIDSAKILVKKNMDVTFKRIDKNSNADFFSVYCNSFAHVLDPHTDYMMPKAKADFDVQMSGTFYGIGASLKEENGYCTIVSIISGSPCWKQGSLKVDDKITKVAQGTSEPVDVVGWEINDIIGLIRGKKNTEVRLTVKHKDGKEEVVPIIRDEVHLDAVFAKSAIVNEGGKKIGYIILPEFYADFQKAGGKRCAVDMLKEIEKLKAEGIDGLVVDLRWNGGGSLYDVVEIASMFVGKQPIVQVRNPDGNAEPLISKGQNKIYDGPLAIMVNNFSASASEILAAAIQDYNRGIVVGSTTHGKGTVQRGLEMDGVLENIDKSLYPLGSLKLTLQKFYRANGGSTQLKGVTPDVTFPDLYMYLDNGERKDKYALPWDQITPSAMRTGLINRESVVANNNSVVNNSAYFNLVKEKAKQLKVQNDDNVYSLNETFFKAQIAKNKEFTKKLEDLDKDKVLLEIYNPRVDMDKILEDEANKKKNEDWLKALKKDEVLKQTINIVKEIKTS